MRYSNYSSGVVGETRVEVQPGATHPWWVAIDLDGEVAANINLHGDITDLGRLARDIIVGLAGMPLSEDEVRTLYDLVEPLADKIMETP